MNAIILSIGTELTFGQTVDTNSAWLSRRLAEVGIPVLMHVTVPDSLEPIRDEIARAATLADTVIVTGGLGPTEDDLSRQALAAAMGVELEFRPAILEDIRAFFTARRREMPDANRLQAMFPAGSNVLENTCGTAPGIRARLGHSTVFVVPGVPREMQVMFDRSILPELSAAGGGAVILARTLYTFGAGESDIGTRIADLMQRGRNPLVGTTAQQMVIGVRILARGESREAAQTLLDSTVEEVKRRLGTLVYGQDDETLAIAAGRLLKACGRTLATAESCTGGLLAGLITDVPGSSAYFLGGLVTYANAAKTELLGVPADLIVAHGAVSPQVAEGMAVGCRARMGSDYALSVTGIAGPDGGTAEKPVGLVYIGLADETGCEVTEHRLGATLTRAEIRDRTCKVALNRLRLKLLTAS